MKKWYIIHEGNEEAVKLVFAAVSRYTVVSCLHEDELSAEVESEGNLIYVGVAGRLEAPENGYRIKAYKNSFGNQIIELWGDGEINTLYAAADFENKYLVKAKNADIHCPVYYFHKLFESDMPDYDESFVPYIKERALWTWGYVIYDYKGYIDNMVKLKLNMLIIWNDYPPLNADALVDYAHRHGVKIIWGFSWGWSTNSLGTDISDLDAISDKVLADYEKYYAHLGGDGIYCQTFTETSEDNIGGRVIAEAAVSLINRTAARLLEKEPKLHIQFGLHATSVKNKLEYIQAVDPRVTILWEDCGAFPYAYIPKVTEGFEETLAFSDSIKNLRSGGFGELYKGMTALDWSTFKHQPGPFVLGEYDRDFIAKKTEEKRPFWKYIQAYWIENAHYVKETVERADPDTLIAALVEDGLFDAKVWYPVAVYAEMLWDPHRETSEILRDTALMEDVSFG